MTLTTVAEAVLDAADRATREENWHDAFRLWRQAAALFPHDGHIIFQLGVASLHRGELASAEHAFSIAIATQSPDDQTSALNGLAATARVRRQFWQAQRWLQKAIPLSPSEALLWSNIGDVVRARSRDDLAYRYLMRAQALDATNADIQFNFALTLHMSPPSLALAGVARLAGSEDHRIRRTVPRILARKGFLDDALAATEANARLYPGDAAIELERGEFEFALGRTADAQRSYKRSVALDPALRRGSGDLREVTLLTEPDYSGQQVSPPPGAADKTEHAQYLAHAQDAVVLREIWAAILPDGSCHLRRFTPISEGGERFYFNIVFSHQKRMLVSIAKAVPAGVAGAVLIGGCDNFSHWLYDWSSKLRLAITLDGLRRRPIIVDGNAPRFANELMTMLGVESDRVVRQTVPACRYRDLWLPSIGHEHTKISPEHVNWMRERFGVPRLPRSRPRRLFISRRHARHRRIANLSEIEPIIRRFGLEEIHPETMPLAAQLELFASTELWLGVMGGASASILLCPSACAVIELTHHRLLTNQCEQTALIAGQTFRQIIGEITHLGESQPKYDFDWDVVISPEVLARTLHELLD